MPLYFLGGGGGTLLTPNTTDFEAPMHRLLDINSNDDDITIVLNMITICNYVVVLYKKEDDDNDEESRREKRYKINRHAIELCNQ